MKEPIYYDEGEELQAQISSDIADWQVVASVDGDGHLNVEVTDLMGGRVEEIRFEPVANHQIELRYTSNQVEQAYEIREGQNRANTESEAQ